METIEICKKGNECLDKVSFAKMILEKYPNPDYDKLDLRKRISDLIEFIKDANK